MDIEQLLQVWARWCCKIEDGAVGNSRNTPVGGMLRDGGILEKGFGPRPIPGDSTAETVEVMVVHLHRFNPELASVLRHAYAGRGTARQKARDPGINPTTISQRADLARQWLVGWLVG